MSSKHNSTGYYVGPTLGGGGCYNSTQLFAIPFTGAGPDGIVGNGDDIAARLDPNSADGAGGVDGDSDGDGAPNLVEYMFGTDPTDGKSCIQVDPAESDMDGDGLKDVVETGTGIYVSMDDTGTNPLNYDSDGDGMDDSWELGCYMSYGDFMGVVSVPFSGAGHDGIVGNGDDIATRLDPNSADGANGADGDPDGDGMANYYEYMFRTDPTDGLSNIQVDPAKSDIDWDGLKDAVETGTGIYVSMDDTGTNPLNYDSDGDGMDDSWELGYKYLMLGGMGDGAIELVPVPFTGFGLDGSVGGDDDIALRLDPNSADGANGACGDPDGDGLSNFEEYMLCTDPTDGTSQMLDNDGDGISDVWEDEFSIIVDNTDPDGDGLSSYKEFLLFLAGFDIDPTDFDSDDDYLKDGSETGTGVYISLENTGTDPCENDSDGDNLPDGWEIGEVSLWEVLFQNDENIKEIQILIAINFTGAGNDGIVSTGDDLNNWLNPNSGLGNSNPAGDMDGDGDCNFVEYILNNDPTDGTSCVVDKDGDGMDDDWEQLFGNVLNDSGADYDKDGMSDCDEYKAWFKGDYKDPIRANKLVTDLQVIHHNGGGAQRVGCGNIGGALYLALLACAFLVCKRNW